MEAANARRSPIAADVPGAGPFLALAFASSWLGAGVPWLLGVSWEGFATVAIGAAFMCGPALAAIVLTRRRGGRLRDLGLRLNGLSWVWLAVWLAPLALVALTIGFSVLLPDVAFTTARDAVLERMAPHLDGAQAAEVDDALHALPVHPFWIGLPQALIAGATINLVFALGEELGWRGYLENAWRHIPFWKRNLAIGAVWGFWHAPLILQGHNYPDHPVLGVAMMVGFCVLLSPLHSWARARTRSVLAPALLHGTINGAAGLALLPVVGGNDLLVGVTGLAGFVALAVLVGLVAWDRQRGATPLDPGLQGVERGSSGKRTGDATSIRRASA